MLSAQRSSRSYSSQRPGVPLHALWYCCSMLALSMCPVKLNALQGMCSLQGRCFQQSQTTAQLCIIWLIAELLAELLQLGVYVQPSWPDKQAVLQMLFQHMPSSPCSLHRCKCLLCRSECHCSLPECSLSAEQKKKVQGLTTEASTSST